MAVKRDPSRTVKYRKGCILCGKQFAARETPGYIPRGYVCEKCCREHNVPCPAVNIGGWSYDKSRPTYYDKVETALRER